MFSSQIPSGNCSGGCQRTAFRKNVNEEEVLAVRTRDSGNGGEEKIAAAQTQRKETKYNCRHRSEGDSTSYRRVSVNTTYVLKYVSDLEEIIVFISRFQMFYAL